MRHRLYGHKLNRTHNQRQQLFRSLIHSFFQKGYLQTTNAKAKAVVAEIEKICHLAVKADLVSIRKISQMIQDKHLVANLVSVMKTNFANQTSNFTKIEKIKYRQGDNSLIVKLSLIKPVSFAPAVKPEEVKENKEKEKKEVKAKKETKK